MGTALTLNLTTVTLSNGVIVGGFNNTFSWRFVDGSVLEKHRSTSMTKLKLYSHVHKLRDTGAKISEDVYKRDSLNWFMQAELQELARLYLNKQGKWDVIVSDRVMLTYLKQYWTTEYNIIPFVRPISYDVTDASSIEHFVKP